MKHPAMHIDDLHVELERRGWVAFNATAEVRLYERNGIGLFVVGCASDLGWSLTLALVAAQHGPKTVGAALDKLEASMRAADGGEVPS